DGLTNDKDGRHETFSTTPAIEAEVAANSELWLRSVKLEFNQRPGNRKPDPELATSRPIKDWQRAEGKAEFAGGPDGWKVLKGGPGSVRSAVEFPHAVVQMEAKLVGEKPRAVVALRGPAGKADDEFAYALQSAPDGKLAIDPSPRRMPVKAGEPFHLTVAVCENDAGAWVNGVPVSVWSAGPVPKDAKEAVFKRGPVVLKLPEAGTELHVRNVRYVRLIGDVIPPGKEDGD
ncbi:MAG TPA: hypothetical protein VKE74_14815, partial [Gemmataceae bacterium]|nr:hypothetical protein [Gemmataceae bacterium]